MTPDCGFPPALVHYLQTESGWLGGYARTRSDAVGVPVAVAADGRHGQGAHPLSVRRLGLFAVGGHVEAVRPGPLDLCLRRPVDAVRGGAAARAWARLGRPARGRRHGGITTMAAGRIIIPGCAAHIASAFLDRAMRSGSQLRPGPGRRGDPRRAGISATLQSTLLTAESADV